jgi:hypothetical protein
MKRNIHKVLAGFLMAAMICTSAGFFSSANASAANDPTKEAVKAGKTAFDGSGNKEYHVYFMYQSQDSWTFRNPFFDKLLGRTSNYWAKMNTKGKKNQVASTKVTDVTIKGNGTFTVGVTGLNGLVSKDKQINFIGFSSDIPSSAKDKVKFTNVTINTDGKFAALQKEGYLDPDALDAPKTLSVDVVNIWNKELSKTAPTLMLPQDKISVTFMVSGFDKDDPNGKPTAAPQATQAAGTTSSNHSGIPMPAIAGIIIGVVVVAGIIIVVVRKKKA